MRLVSNQVSQAFARRLEGSGVTVAEWVILREMYDGDKVMAPSQVAQLTGLTRGAVSKLIDRLVEKDLVVRKEASSDRRYQDIRLSRAARALVPQLSRHADENDETFFSVLSASERRQLLDLLKKTADLNHLTRIPLE
ncbi:MAG: MarR family transcriptional regulator [Bdellovibrionaceae bacterium]|nr:MarR family transcriptional regulator [Pseudobdellovibrionaceae bacterium]